MTIFPCRSDDFCIEHGYEHMRSRLGDPICFCQACEDESEKTAQPVLALTGKDGSAAS